MDERFTELEIRYSHQQDQLEKLNQVVYEHERTIERLTARVLQLEQALGDVADGIVKPLPVEKPPHY